MDLIFIENNSLTVFSLIKLIQLPLRRGCGSVGDVLRTIILIKIGSLN